MKKTKGFIYFLVLLFLSPLVILSCNDFSDSSQNDSTQTTKSSKNTVTFIGEFSLDGALPSEIADALNNKETAARSAVPSVPSDVTFYAKVSALNKEDKVISNDDFDKTGTNKITFNLSLDTGIEWTIEAGIKNGETIILKDSCTVTLNANQPVFSHIFILKPDTNSTGDIDLSINVCEGVKKLKITSDNNNWPNDLKEISFQGSNTYSLSKSEVKSGIYSAVFYFYGEDDILLYSTTQNITVFSGMTTKTWVSDGSGVIKGGEFELSQDLITQFTRTTFYVGSTSVGIASDETGSGSVYSPLESVTKAASIIAAVGDSSKDYRIYVCGEVTGAQEISEAINDKANSLTIEGVNGLDSNGEPKDILDGAFNWDSQGTVLTISSCTVPITIKNLKITGGCNSANGGGISISGKSNNEKANLTLDIGTLITENYIKPSSFGDIVIRTHGAGIYMFYGRLTMKSGAVITGNKTIQYSESISQIFSSGAGIGLNAGSEFLMEGGEITGNTAYGDGGAVCMETNPGYPGVSVTLSGGLIEDNKCQQGNGGSIADLSGTSLTIGDSIYIPYGAKNEQDEFVKAAGMNDIYLADGKIITLAGSLTAHSESDKVTITYAGACGKTVIQADENKVNNLTPYKNYFAFTWDRWEARISEDQKSLFLEAPIYVAGSGRKVCTADGKEDGDGSKAKPFDTIANAITVMDDNTADYTIYIDGTVTGTQTIPSTLTNTTSGTYKAASLTIEGVNGLDSNEEPKDELNGNQIGTTLKVESNVPVSITNLKISGGKDSNGGGLYVGSSSSTVKLLDGTLITGNEATLGGGVYNQGSLYMSGSAMVGKSTDTIAKSLSYGNKATMNGAGICSISGAKLYLGYTSWTNESTYNCETLTGGVCGNFNSSSTNAFAQGGGIYNKGSIYFASGNVSYNYALNGAGIYTEESVTMTGGTIEGNEGDASNSAGSGGGVYVTGGSTFSMSGNAQIKNNKNMALGAGVYLNYNNSRLIMAGGTISGNIAETNGGAVYMHDMNATNRSLLEIAGEANIPYGGEAKNNDIFMLDTNVRVTIKQSLSARDAGNVIGITPNSYTEGRQLLAAEDGVPLANEVGKFTVTPEVDHPEKPWRINSSGNLTGIWGTKTASAGYAVGDIVFNDGSAIPYTSGLTFTNEEKAAAIAVIYYAGNSGDVLGAKTLGVGLKNTSNLAWCLDDADGYSKSIDAIKCSLTNTSALEADFDGDIDGSDNWQALCNVVSDEDAIDMYPAWEWVNSYKTKYSLTGTYANGWYLPSIAELCVLYRAVKAESSLINAALEASGGTKISNDDYWLSSQNAGSGMEECAVSLSFKDGFVYYGQNCDKHIQYSVCAVYAF